MAREHRLPDGYRVGCSRGDLPGKCERQATGRAGSPSRALSVANVLDGVVAGVAFLILAAMSGFRTGSIAAVPRSGVAAVEILFVLVEVVIVATVVLIAMIYDPSRPSRANYLLIAGGS